MIDPPSLFFPVLVERFSLCRGTPEESGSQFFLKVRRFFSFPSHSSPLVAFSDSSQPHLFSQAILEQRTGLQSSPSSKQEPTPSLSFCLGMFIEIFMFLLSLSDRFSCTNKSLYSYSVGLFRENRVQNRGCCSFIRISSMGLC